MSAVITAGAPPSAWRAALLPLACVLVALLALYRDSFAAMVGIWSRSDTFAHAFLVPPIAAWLAWRSRARLALLVPRPAAWALLPMSVVAIAWLVGDMVGVNALTQLMATAMLVLAVPALLGGAVAWELAFPLAFLFFMVPVGEFVMPTMMQWTADVTVSALKLFGVPVYREGLQFVIPSGNWSVVEACSGVRYLIASFMVGSLFAYLNFNTLRRRLVFCAVSILVPIVANWMRAVMIVMLGHLSDNRLAAGVDHLVYGWVFFGVIVAAMFYLGSRWAEPAPAAEGAAAPVPERGTRALLPLWATATMLVLVAGLPPAASWLMAADTLKPPRLEMPALQAAAAAPAAAASAPAEAAATPAPAAETAAPEFRPLFIGASAEATRTYAESSPPVTVHVAYYRRQTYGHKLASSENVLVRADDRRWRLSAQGEKQVNVSDAAVPLRTAELRAGAVGASAGAERLQVRQLYWVGGRLTTSDVMATAYAVVDQIGGRGDDAAALSFYTAGADDRALDAFVARHLEAFTAWLASVRAER